MLPTREDAERLAEAIRGQGLLEVLKALQDFELKGDEAACKDGASHVHGRWNRMSKRCETDRLGFELNQHRSIDLAKSDRTASPRRFG